MSRTRGAHRTMLEVNAVGTFNGTLAALELMLRRRRAATSST